MTPTKDKPAITPIAAIVAAAGRTIKKPLPPARPLSDASQDFRKIASFAFSGRGKTYFLIGLLRAGLKVYVAETDMGGSGLATVREALRDSGELHLLDNLMSRDFAGQDCYENFKAFCDTGNETVSTLDGVSMSLWDWDPDFLVWEGLSNWQARYCNDKILSYDATRVGDKASDLRKAGIALEGYGDWDGIQNETLRHIDRFLCLHNPNTGKRIHKYVTFQSDRQDEDLLTGENKRGPLMKGRARGYLVGGFDLIIEITSTAIGQNVKYQYKCELGGSSVAKKRGLHVEPAMEADSCKLWELIKPGR